MTAIAPAAAVSGERGAVDRVDGDVGQRRRAVADVLAVEEHGRLVLLALADDDDAVHRHALQDDPHGVDGRLVRPFLVPAAHPAPRGERRGLGHADKLHGEVPVGQLALVAHGADDSGRPRPARRAGGLCSRAATGSTVSPWIASSCARAGPLKGTRRGERGEELRAQAHGRLPARPGPAPHRQRPGDKRRRHHVRRAAGHGRRGPPRGPRARRPSRDRRARPT